MLVKIKYREVKVHRKHSQNLGGAEKFTAGVTYQTFGSVECKPFRLPLGADENPAAKRRTAKIERALLEGATSPLWAELSDSLPPTTFKFFATQVGCRQVQDRSLQSRCRQETVPWRGWCSVGHRGSTRDVRLRYGAKDVV